jgi:predicted transcriptional regulator
MSVKKEEEKITLGNNKYKFINAIVIVHINDNIITQFVYYFSGREINILYCSHIHQMEEGMSIKLYVE